MWREDDTFRTLTAAAVSFGCTACFAFYHGYVFFRFGSIWHGGIGIFYFLLMVVRGIVLITEKRNRRRPASVQSFYRHRSFVLSSILLFILDLSLIHPISMMVLLKKPVEIGLIPAIAMATYTFTKVTTASHHLRRKHENVLVLQLRAIAFIEALVSILTLQNTLIMVAGTPESANNMLSVCAASSAIIYLVILIITLRMLGRGLKLALQ